MLKESRNWRNLFRRMFFYSIVDKLLDAIAMIFVCVVGWLIDWFISLFIECLIDWLIDWLYFSVGLSLEIRLRKYHRLCRCPSRCHPLEIRTDIFYHLSWRSSRSRANFPSCRWIACRNWLHMATSLETKSTRPIPQGNWSIGWWKSFVNASIMDGQRMQYSCKLWR